MNKINSQLSAVFLVLSFLGVSVFMGGCAVNGTENSTKPLAKKVIYTSFYPVQDLTVRIVGNKIDVRTIIQSGAELHDFEMRAKELAEISRADLIIYNGAGAENFIADLRTSINNDDKFLDLSRGISLITASPTAHNAHANVNPHTWLSIKNTLIELETIYRKIAVLDPANEPFYKENLHRAQAEFLQLDKKFTIEFAKIPSTKKYFISSHDAFSYLARDYDLKQTAVTGISPQIEPSGKDLAAIAKFIEKHRISTIFFAEKATPKVARTLARETGVNISTLHTLENLTDAERSIGYHGLMERNLDVLLQSFKD